MLPERTSKFGWSGDGGLGDRLIDRIISGRKTATACPKVLYSAAEIRALRGTIGRALTVVDKFDRPRCAILQLDVFETRLGSPDPRLYKGEGYATPEAYRKAHRDVWTDLLDEKGAKLTEDTVLLAEVFKRVELRDAALRDLPAFYAMHADPEANRRGAFVPRTKDAFFKHWAKVLKNRLVLKKALLFDRKVAGYVVSFFRTGTGKPRRREIGYWIAREHWGKGLAGAGLSMLLEKHRIRPLYARVAKTNPASRRVAEKCGFKVVKEDSYLNEAGKRVEEFVLRLGLRLARGGAASRPCPSRPSRPA